MANVYSVGSLVRTSETFTDAAGTLIDPTTVTLKWNIVPNGTGSPGSTTTWTYLGTGSIVKDSTGKYHADLDTTSLPGQWQGAWIAPPGSGQTATDWIFIVFPSPVH